MEGIMRTIAFLIAAAVIVSFSQPAAAEDGTENRYRMNLNKMHLISCEDTMTADNMVTARPLKAGAVMLPASDPDLSEYDRIRIRITPVSADFTRDSFGVALRVRKEYFFAKLIENTEIRKEKTFEMVFDITGLPRKNIDFLRIYFNRNGKEDKQIQFRIDEVEFYQNKKVSELPEEKYQRKLDKTFIFPRIQIKYSLFMNYYAAASWKEWIDRPLLFSRALTENTEEFDKGGNQASFTKNAEIVSAYLDGFSILATSKSYLDRTLASMRYADRIGKKNFIMPEVSPAVTRLGKNPEMSKDYDFIFKIAEAAASSPSAFRINDKIVISSYNADLIPPEQWRPIVDKLKKQSGGQLIFIIEIRNEFYNANGTYLKNGGKISLEEIAKLKRVIRSYLDVADGILFAGCNHIVDISDNLSSYKFGNAFYRKILIPAIISVMNEPEYKNRYLGLSAAKGYFGVRNASGGQTEGGTKTLRDSLEAALAATPDFIILPEWNEANENTHIEPTIYDSFSSQRIVNHYRGINSSPGDDTSIPNLIVSYRKELVYGENLMIELLNLPDPACKPESVEIELRLKNAEGKIVKQFDGFSLSNRQMAEKYLKVPSEDFEEERFLIPELIICSDGKRTQVDGLAAILLTLPPTMNKKFVKQPIRDLCRLRKNELNWNEENGTINVRGQIESESLLGTVELLENNVAVAALDVRNEYHCSPDEILLRFCWNSGVSSNRPVSCVIKPLKGEVNIIGHRYITPTEAKQEKTRKKGRAITKKLRFTSYLDEFFFKADKNSLLEISIGNRKKLLKVADLVQFGIWRQVFPNSDMIAVEYVKRLPEIPYPINRKNIVFRLEATPISHAPVYSLRIVDADGKIFRSKPFIPGKNSGETIVTNVWSFSRGKVVSLKLPAEYANQVNYIFTPKAGDILPTADRLCRNYANLGGFNSWNSLFCGKDAVSTPVWKTGEGTTILEFDGKGNYLTIPAFLMPEQSFSISFSLMPYDDSKQVLLQTYSSVHPGFQVILEDSRLNGYFLNRKGKSFPFQTSAHLKAGKWNDIIIRYDMKNLSFQINGEKAEFFPCSGLLYKQPCLIFGGSYPPETAHRFKGLLRSLSVAGYLR